MTQGKVPDCDPLARLNQCLPHPRRRARRSTGSADGPTHGWACVTGASPMCHGVAVSSTAPPTIYFEDFAPGSSFDLGRLVIEEKEMVAFAERFDPQWYHVDRARAEASPWGRLIASGFFTVSALMRMYVDAVLTHAAADTSPGMENLRWFAPVYAGDELTAVLTVTDAQPSTRSAELGTVFLQWQMHRGPQLVLQMNGRGWFLRRTPPPRL